MTVVTSSPLAARLGRFIHASATTALASNVREKAATCLLDGLALGIAARAEPATRSMLKSPFLQGGGNCTVWADGSRASLSDAVALNGFAVHARFQDDCDMTSWTHPGSLVVPVAVSVAEAAGASLEATLRGIVCGYAVLNWLGANEKVGRAVVARSFRGSPTLGPVGAAAAAATVLDLKPEEAANAVAIAAASAGGIIETVRSGSSDWRFQNGSAAWRGVFAAILAQQGIDGAPEVFESPKGFIGAFAGIAPPPEMNDDPDPASILMVWAKPYPTLGDHIAVVAAALKLREDAQLNPAAIAEIRVHQNSEFASYPGTSYRGPFVKPTQAIASTAFAVSATLARGAITFDLYSTALDDPLILSLIERLRITPENDYGYLDGKVVVVSQDGSELTCETAELSREFFYRDAATAVDAFGSILQEVGITEGTSSFATDLLGRVNSGATDATLADVLAAAMALREAQPSNDGGGLQ